MLSREKSLFCHRLLARTRALCAALELNRPRIEGPVLTGIGAEGISIGTAFALMELGILERSLTNGDHRTQFGFAVAKDEVLAGAHSHVYEILKNYALAATSMNRGEDGNIHWGCTEHGIPPFASSDMGRMASVVVGMAEEMRRRVWPSIANAADRPVAITVFGEGAANQGVVHEAMNWAAASNCRLTSAERVEHEPFLDAIGRELGVLRGAPVIFIVNRNQFSIYTEEREEHGRSDLFFRAFGYGAMKGVRVDGTNVFEVVEKMRAAVRDAQSLTPVLLQMDTYRLTGHNADQIKRRSGALDDGEIAGVEPEDFKRAWLQMDPVKNCRDTIAAAGYASRDELETVERDEYAAITELFERAFAERPAELSERKHLSVFVPHEWKTPPVPAAPGETTRLRYKEAFVKTLADILRRDPAVTAFGEDIHRGGVLAETAGKGGYLLAKEFGEARVHSAPISEEAITGVAAGRALAGGAPWCFYQFAPFWADSYPIWRSVISTNWWQKRMRFPLRAVAPFGVVQSGGSGEYHEACIEGPFWQMDGVALLFPTDAYDVAGLVRAAHEYPGPAVLFLQICAFGDSQYAADVPDEPYVIPFGAARVRRAGKDLTVIAYGAAAVIAAENEAEFLSRDGIDCEVIDIRSLVPLDIAALAASATKTGRVVIMHEATERGGCGVHIKHELDRAGATLAARTPQSAYLCVADNNPVPTKKEFVWDRLPFEQYALSSADNFRIGGTILRSRKLARLARELMRY